MAALTQAQLIYLIDVQLKSQTNQILGALDKRLQSLGRSAKQAETGLQRLQKAMLQLGLSTFFFGMMLGMVGKNLMTSLVTAFVTARAEGDFLVNRLLSMQAAFEFLKFAIFDAFAQSDLFLTITQAIIDITNWVSQLVAKHPLLSMIVVGFALLAISLGAVFMIIGQVAMGINAVATLLVFIKPLFLAVFSKAALAAGIVAAKLLLITAYFSLLLGAILLIVAGIGIIVLIWENLVNAFKIRIGQLQIIFGQWFDTLITNFQQVGANIKLFSLNAKKALLDGLGSGIKWISDKLDKMIRAYNALNPFSKMQEISFGGFNTSGISADIEAQKQKMTGGLSDYNERTRLRDLEYGRLKYELALNKQDADAKVQEAFENFKNWFTGNESATASDATTENTNTENNVQMTFNGTYSADEIKKMMDDYFGDDRQRILGSPKGG